MMSGLERTALIRAGAWRAAVSFVAVTMGSCGSRITPKTEPCPGLAQGRKALDNDAILALAANDFLDSPLCRRQATVASLTNPANSYSLQRLGSYSLGDVGWDLLPEWVPQVTQVTLHVRQSDNKKESSEQRAARLEELPLLWDGKRPETQQGWIDLGRKVFFEYPLRAEYSIEHLLAVNNDRHTPQTIVNAAAIFGIDATSSGMLPGIVEYLDPTDGPRVGITCALCHSVVNPVAPDQLIVGQARRNLDFGALRLGFFQATGAPLDPNMARRMASWGPGRADVTEDDDEDPVAIPDLWNLRDQQYLTQAGTIRHIGPAALAIRQETQLLHANMQRVRPPRELAWALAMFVYSLQPPEQESVVEADQRGDNAAGEELFVRHCAHCHTSPSFSGDALPHAVVGTDPALAIGHGRGTGLYRVPSLVRVRFAAPYLHDGSVRSLAELLGRERFAADFIGLLAKRVHAKGPIVGHDFGTQLPAAHRAALIRFLESL
jgi:mono/diheme cytochrome c family protein